jgi:hypothetical protein
MKVLVINQWINNAHYYQNIEDPKKYLEVTSGNNWYYCIKCGIRIFYNGHEVLAME